MASEFYTGGFLYNPKTKEILLHKRDNKTINNPNKWGFFGGLSEGTETPEETFIREMKEELNIEISVNELIKLCSYLNTERNIFRHIFYVESDRKKSEMTLGEGADFEWVPLESAFDYDLTSKSTSDLKMFIAKIS